MSNRFQIANSVDPQGTQGPNAPVDWGDNRFNPLGFELRNIPIPGEDFTFAPGTANDQYYQGKGIRDRVVGYKIYYATRTQKDMTILDSGLIHGHTITQGASNDGYASSPRGVKWFPTVNQSTWSGAFNTAINGSSAAQNDAPAMNAPHDPTNCTEKDSRFFTMQPLDTLINKKSIQSAALIKGTAYCSPWNPQLGSHDDHPTNGLGGTGTTASGRYQGVVRYDVTSDQENIRSSAESHMIYDMGIQRMHLAKSHVRGFSTTTTLNYQSDVWDMNQYISLKGKTYLPAGVLYNSIGGFSYGIDNLMATEALAFEANEDVAFAKWHGDDVQVDWNLAAHGVVFSSTTAVWSGNFRIYHACGEAHSSTWYGVNQYAARPGNCNAGQTGNPLAYYFGNATEMSDNTFNYVGRLVDPSSIYEI